MSVPSRTHLEAVLAFLAAAQRLKDTHRSGRTQSGASESVAAHSWGVCLLAVLMEEAFAPCDMERLLKLCVIHDLGEVISGDIPAIDQDPAVDKTPQERADFKTLIAPLPEPLRAEMLDLWEEYTAAQTREAQLAKGLDKIETMLQHVSGCQMPNFDYLWNLNYGRGYTDLDPALKALRACVDERTKAADQAR